MKFYQIDSFTDEIFRGNPAAVCLVGGAWPPVGLMQAIAAENNLSETAFVLDNGESLAIRWLTPTTEVPLCGHATLAAAHVLFRHEGYSGGELVFESMNHRLVVSEGAGGLLTLDFPADTIERVDFTPMLDCFNAAPIETWRGTEEYMLIFESQAQIENMRCDFAKAALIDQSGIIVTAPSADADADFVSRYFAPKIGIDEDPVTGSTHTMLMPYWSGVLGKKTLAAKQLSKRGGRLYCELDGRVVKISGTAVTYCIGELLL